MTIKGNIVPDCGFLRLGAACVLLLILGGCALSGRREFDAVSDTIESRSGEQIQWYGDDAEARSAAQQIIVELMREPLTADASVKIALLNNRSLQATFEEIGLARAEVVQSSLLPNPTFEGSYQSSTNNGEDPAVEIAIAQHVIELLTLPIRRKISKDRMEAVKARVGQAILSLASEVRAQFYAVQSDEQMLEMMRQVVRSTGAAEEASNRLRDAGNITAFEHAQNRSLHSRARLNLAAAELMAQKERERLNILMGLWGEQLNVQIPPRLPEPPVDELDLDEIERLAVQSNFGLDAMRHEILAAGRGLGLTRATALIPEFELGGAFAREDDGNHLFGPSAVLPIPLFDQGQPRVRAAKGRLRKLQEEYYQKGVEVRASARAARAHLLLARERVDFSRQVDLPLAHEMLEQSQREYDGMQIGVFQLLQAKENEIEAGRRYIEDLREYWTARTEVEAILQGHVTEFGMQITPLDEVPGSPLH